MNTNSKVQQFLADASQHDSYWVEQAKLNFSIAMENRRKNAKMSYKDIAAKIATSAAYVTKIFRGDSNLTIETMVKLARATGGNLSISITDRDVVGSIPSYTSSWTNGARLTVINQKQHVITTQAATVQTADVSRTEELKAA